MISKIITWYVGCMDIACLFPRPPLISSITHESMTKATLWSNNSIPSTWAKYEQNKKFDWSDFIGWSKQTIWWVQLFCIWRGFETHFHFIVTRVPFLKSCLQVVSFVSGRCARLMSLLNSDHYLARMWTNSASVLKMGWFPGSLAML